MDFSIFDSPRPAIQPAEAEALVRDIYGVEGRAEPLHGERDRSFKIGAGVESYVLKVGNGADHPAALEANSAAMDWARSADPGLPIPAVIRTLAGDLSGEFDGHGIQLIEYIGGSAPASTATPPGFRRSLGAVAGRLSVALNGFDHPLLHRSFPWDMSQLPELADLLEYVGESSVRAALEKALDRFTRVTRPALLRLGGQAVHGDLNNDNVVVDSRDRERIVGVFDFGDMSWGPRIIDLAVAATYQTFGADPVEAIAQVASAFHSVAPLRDVELEVLPGLVEARCVQSALMSARSAATHPENREYSTSDADAMAATLRRFEGIDRGEATARIARACGLGRPGSLSFSDSLLLRRARLGPALTLSYRSPVRLDRGYGVWLFDSDGNRLLDAYNNVPHVGHAHPEVVAAVSAQLSRLSTNTRYLVDRVAEYADRLAGLFPDPLSVVMFTNSGSEANDLAFQIARAVTGRRGVVTTENAYHGTTLATTAMSPEEFGEKVESWTEQVLGSEILHSTDPGRRLGAALVDASGRLDDRGEGSAMAIFDTVFSSEGIYDLPEGYLEAARAWADTCGALLVADEVQAGFGRVGARFWGFASAEALPDIVTLGKPIGNGYPMGAVVTTPAIAGDFADNWHFFSTFAGSPVAAAAGTAVLDVLESEDLPARADSVGAYLRAAITDLGLPAVREVRGPGLFTGIELADPNLAYDVVQALRDQGVLIGVTGRDGRVLKIRPPMVFTERHADLVVAALETALANLV